MGEKRNRGDGGFWDFVKDPSYRKGIIAGLIQLPRPGWMKSSPKAIRSLLRRLRDGTTRDEQAVDRLYALEEAAVPYLIEALGDPAFDTREYEGHSLAGSPLEVLLDLLEPFGPPEAIAPLMDRTNSPDANVRKLVARALGNIGAEACLRPLEAAMRDEDEYVRCYAVIGLRYGIEAGRASRALLDGLFEPLVRLLAHPDGFNTSDQAAEALLEIDRERAVPILLGEDVLSRANPYVYKTIRVLNVAGVTIPTPRLRALLDELRPEADSYPHEYSYGEALIALAMSGDPGAEEIIREAMTWENKEVSEMAAKALGLLSGIDDPFGFVVDWHQKHGFEALTEPQRHYFTVYLFDAQVRNGGLAQYFVNSYGEHAREALVGLEAMGAPHAASVLRRAMDLFGPDGPSPNRDARHEQLAGLSDEQDNAMEALTQEYFKDVDRVQFRLLRHAHAFPSHFKEDDDPPSLERSH